MHLAALPKIMGIAKLFERCAPANGEFGTHEGLQRYDDVLPLEWAVAASIDARRRLIQPACLDILAAQRRRVAMVLQPCGIHQRTVWELLQLV